MKNRFKLSELQVGKEAFVKSIFADEDMKRRFYDIGLIKNTKVRCVGKSPLGDPCAYSVRGAVIAIRKKDGFGIEVSDFPEGVQSDENC